MKTQAILLTAGLSSRFKTGNKLLHPYRGKPLLHHSIEVLLSSPIDRLIVVTGSSIAGIESSIRATYSDNRLSFASNPHFADGMASSIKAGLSKVSPCDNCLICLADMPLIRPDTINLLIKAGKTDSNSLACVPVYQSIDGNPVLFKPASYTLLRSLTGDKGAKGLIKQNPENIIRIDVADAGIHRDFDTPSDFSHEPN